MRLSRIDIIGQNGNDGEHYAECEPPVTSGASSTTGGQAVNEFNPYKLPPIVAITNCDIQTTLQYASSPEQRKWCAAAIILGQPFI